MEQTIKIGKKSVKLNNNIGWTFIYKDQFGQDIIPTLMPALASVVDIVGGIIKETGKTNEFDLGDVVQVLDTTAWTDAMIHLSGLEFTDFINLTWALAKCANEDIDPPREWVKQFDIFPVDEIAPKLFEMIFSGVTSSKKWERLKEMMKSLSLQSSENSDSKQSSTQELSED